MLTFIHLIAAPAGSPRLAACADTLEGVQSVVGGSFDAVPVDRLDHLIEQEGTFHLLIDGNGKAKDLPVNDLATRLGRLFPGDVVVGDAMLVRTDQCTDPLPLTAEQWDLTLDDVSAIQEWSRVRTWTELLQADVDFLEGRLVNSPGHYGPLDNESRQLTDDLVHLTRHGLMTLNSQPTALADRWQQRSWVRFYVPGTELACALVELLAPTELVCLKAFPGEEVWQNIPITLVDGNPVTFAGRLPADEEHDQWAAALHPDADAIVRSLTLLEVVDPSWDGGRRLWDQVRQAVERLGLPALV